MNDSRIIVRTPNGDEQDVTEEVATVLDCLHGSLDWGSGFLDASEEAAWERVATLLGFDYKIDSRREK